MERRNFIKSLFGSTFAIPLLSFFGLLVFKKEKKTKEKLLVYEWKDNMGNKHFVKSQVALNPVFDGNTISYYKCDNIVVKAIIVLDEKGDEVYTRFPLMPEKEARKYINSYCPEIKL